MASGAVLSTAKNVTCPTARLIRSPLIQFVRHRGFIKPLRIKPRFVPRAPSKMFQLPNKFMIPDDELNQLLKLKFRHQDKFAAVTQYLYEDYLRNSDVGEAAKIEAKREEEEHQRLLSENEEENKRIAALREERLEREAQETAKAIAEKVAKFKDEERRNIELADQLIQREIDDMKDLIRSDEELEKAISIAIDNPIDYEYSIDLEGHIYPGRYTKAKLVPENERRKIGVPTREGELILGLSKEDKIGQSN